MVGGFNTNVRYRGRTFHVQTEDSGQANPKIVTLLYEGGTILFSKKSSYEKHASEVGVEAVVRQLMDAQHRELVEGLKSGDFDSLVEGGAAGVPRAASPERVSGDAAFGDGLIVASTLGDLVLSQLCSE